MIGGDDDFEKMVADAQEQADIEDAAELDAEEKIKQMQNDPEYKKLWEGLDDDDNGDEK